MQLATNQTRIMRVKIPRTLMWADIHPLFLCRHLHFTADKALKYLYTHIYFLA